MASSSNQSIRSQSGQLHHKTSTRSFGDESRSLACKRPTADPAELQQNHLTTLINLWPSLEAYQVSNTKWGDEIEYCILRIDHQNRTVEYATEGPRVIAELTKEDAGNAINIQQEAYDYMVETCPVKPFASDLHTLAKVEEDMFRRRMLIQGCLNDSTAVFTISRFGMFGAPNLSNEDVAITSGAMQKKTGALWSGNRYKSLIGMTAERNGHGMNTTVSLYDATLPQSTSLFMSPSSNTDVQTIAIDDAIFGMGGCAIQVNFGLENMLQALYVHDQLCPIGPLMLALTAGSPVLKGFLVQADARWDACRNALDDRTSSEQHLHPRWGTSPMYFEDLPEVQSLNQPLSSSNNNNDLDFGNKLQQVGVTSPLAKYFASVLNRFQIICPKAEMESHQTSEPEDRFARLKTHLSTLWPHVRLKLPEPDKDMPWLVEFRSMEAQPSDFENAAIAVFLKLLQQTILHYHLEFRVPIHLVNENMNRAQVADAAEKQRFWFNVSNDLSGVDRSGPVLAELGLNEIFHGCVPAWEGFPGREKLEIPFPGVLHYVRQYLDTTQKTTGTLPKDVESLQSYLDFVSRRASCAEPTPAKWMRDFLIKHPSYQGDCKVTHEMYYDMVCTIGRKSKVMLA